MMTLENGGGPNHVVTNGAAYAEVVPRTQRVLVHETPAVTWTVVDDAAVSDDTISHIYLKATNISASINQSMSY